MIAGNFTNNFQFVPEWLWNMHISPMEFTVYMALRSFSYPTGPTIEMLANKTGFDPEAVLETVQSLDEAGLAEPCSSDEYYQPCNDRWRFCYLKYTKDASNPAPVPAPEEVESEDRLRQLRARLESLNQAQYAADRGAKEADERRQGEAAEWRDAEQKQWEAQQQNLHDPNYLRSGGPVNPDISGMIDAVKHLYWKAMASISDMQHKLAELTGLALLDPDANSAFQESLSQLATDVRTGTVSNVVDYDELEAHDFLYEDEFFNTYADGREIVTKISIESEMDVPEAKDYRFILESPAVVEFPLGLIYHIHPVDPPRDTAMRGEETS